MMESLSNFFGNTTVKIAILLSTVLLSLFALLNVVVIKNSEQSFIQIIRQEFEAKESEIEKYPQQIRPFIRDLLNYDISGVERVKPLQELFVDKFQKSLLAIASTGVIVTVILGITLSQVLVQPLRKLQTAISGLKKENYEALLIETGTKEIDDVIQEFNTLVSKLKHTEELRKELISDASHELKTPITSLRGQLEGMKENVLEPTTDRFNMLIDQVNRLDDVVNRLQEFTRLRAKRYSLNLKEVNLNKFVTRFFKKINDTLEQNKFSSYVNIPAKLTINADKNLLEQIFENIINNSIRYSGGNTITVKANNNYISIRDNGSGVPEEKLEDIFERFFRVDKSRSRETGGMGLGLAIVKEITEAHGWSISAENNSGLEIKLKLS